MSRSRWYGGVLAAGFVVACHAAGHVAKTPCDDNIGWTRQHVSSGHTREHAPRPVALSRGVFLVARPHVDNLYFTHSVVLVIDHGEDGTMGVIINRRSPVSLSRFLPDVEELADYREPVYLGGPVSQNVIVLLIHSIKEPEPAVLVMDGVFFSASIDALKEVLTRDSGKPLVHAYLGFAGWAPGQLEHEIERGDWYVAEGDASTVFASDPDRIWRGLIDRLSKQWVRRAGPRHVALQQ